MRIGVLTVTLSAMAALAWQPSLKAASAAEAVKVYREALGARTPPSVRECGDYLFVIVEGDPSQSRDGDLTGLVMERQLDELEKYVGRDNRSPVSPFAGKFAERIRPAESFSVPETAAFTVERKHTHELFRDVTAFELEPLKKARESRASREPLRLSGEEWVASVAEAWRGCDLSREKVEFLRDLGATIPILSKTGTVRCFGNRVDLVKACKAVEAWRSGPKTREECGRVLAECPPYEMAWKRLSELDAEDGDDIRALGDMLKANAADGKFTEDVRRQFQAIGERSGATAWQEFGDLFTNVLANADVFRKGDDAFRAYAVNSFGRAGGAPGKADEKRFGEAKALFRKGERLEEILELMDSVVLSDPGDSGAWHYYAAALRTAGKLQDAVIAYHQTLALDPKDESAALELCGVYRALGCGVLATGNAWWLAATGEREETRKKALAFLKAECGGMFKE